MPPSPIQLEVRDLGRVAYEPALELQRRVQQDVIARRAESGGDGGGMTLLLVEHDPPVITVSRRPGAGANLIATEAQLRRAGVEVAQTDRGGDITYHGPGQLVAYPIIDLNRLGLRINGYMRFLEEVVIDTLKSFGVQGRRDESATGVWVADGRGASAKICALGVRVSRWVSMHGLALNVDPDLGHFGLIVPCGLVGRGVTSMAKLLGSGCPAMEEVKREFTGRFQRSFEAAVSAESERTHPDPSAA